MKGLGTFGKRVASGAAGSAGVVAAQPPAHARAPPVPAAQPVATILPKCEDDWMLTDFSGTQLLFKPFSPTEVEEVVAQVGAATARHTPAPHACVIEELEEDGGLSSPPTGASSEGSQADLVIESTHVGPQQQQMADLLKISSKLMQRPGMQREIVSVMLEEPEVRELLLKQSCNLDQYLAAVGVHAPNLLLPPAAQAAEASDEDGGPPPVLEAILNAMTSCMDGVGWLGGWIRDRFQGFGHMLASRLGFSKEQLGSKEKQQNQGSEQSQYGSGGGRSAQSVMTTVMVISVALLCMLLARRPILRPAF